MRVQRFDVGLESISRWQFDDEQHLPKNSKLPPKFLPRAQALDDILKRPSLDERLPRMLEPEIIDLDLLDPTVLTQARKGALAVFLKVAQDASGPLADALRQAADVLDREVAFDEAIRAALAELLKG